MGAREVVVPRGDVGVVGARPAAVEGGPHPAEPVEAALVGVGEEAGVGRRGDAGAAERAPGPVEVGGHRPCPGSAGYEMSGTERHPAALLHGLVSPAGKPTGWSARGRAPLLRVAAAAGARRAVAEERAVPHGLGRGRRAAQGRAAGADHGGLRPRVVDAEVVGVGRVAVLGPESPEAAIIVCPCSAIREKIVFSAWRVAPAVSGFAVAPARGHDLGGVVAGDPVEQVEGLGVVVVRRLVDHERGRGRVEGRELGVERGLALASRWPARPAVDEDVADGAGQPVAGLERFEVARRVLLELHDGDRLAEPVRPWPNSWSSPKMEAICVDV